MPLATATLVNAATPSVWDRWVGRRSASAFRTARSALAALLTHRKIERLFLPSYTCISLADAAQAIACPIEYFAVNARLVVDAETLAPRLRSGDAVLGIDYFGMPADAAFQKLAKSRRDILWIEDRAQALDPGAPAWGDVILYSPRKLFGVADGGILVADSDLPHPEPGDPETTAMLWRPQIARAADPAGLNPESWYLPSQKRENELAVDSAAMSPLTRTLLETIALAPEAAARRRNFAVLAEHLGVHALFPHINAPSFAPLAFPILVEDCQAVSARLAAQKIFCARHWPIVPIPAADFPDSHRLASQCLSIPCEPRYDTAQMHAVGALVRAAIER